MRIVFVTAHLPHGADEAFIVPEIQELIRAGHQVLLVPRSPRGAMLHGKSLVEHSRIEPLFSTRVMGEAAAVALSSPVDTSAAVSRLLSGSTPRMALKNLAVVPKALWLSAVATEWGADHIHSHWAGTTATLAMLASKLSGIPWSFTAHRWDIVENNRLAEKVQRAAFARFISEDGLRMARSIGIGPAPNARVLVMGIELPAVVDRSPGPSQLVVCPARLVEVKGHRFLIEAWRILRDRGVRAELWLAGDGELRPELETLTSRLGLQDSVKFLGTLAHDDLLRIYKEAPVTAVVLASNDLGNGLHEGIPVALIEAMGYGIPVVATQAGGTPELVKPGTGLLVPPGNSSALAGAIQLLLRDCQLAGELGKAARRHVVNTHDIAAVASDFAKAVEASLPPGKDVSIAA